MTTRENNVNTTGTDFSMLKIRIPYVDDFNFSSSRKNTYISDFRSRENLFLDIGLNLDCIGGSRANDLFLAPFGIRNQASTRNRSTENEFNHVFSLSHKKIVCGYGSNPYNFSGALQDLALASGKNYTVHTVTFDDLMREKFFNDIHPSYAGNRHNDKLVRAKLQDLHYAGGMENYFIRLLDFKKNVRAKIDHFGDKVEKGRKTKFIFLFLSELQWRDVSRSPSLMSTLSYIYNKGHEEKILLIPCAEKLSDIPLPLLTHADMITGYGAHNVSVIKKIVEHKGLKFKVAKAENKLQTVGLSFDNIKKPYLYPLKGWTQEFFLAKEKREQWEKQEKDEFLAYISSLDDGSLYDIKNARARDNLIKKRKEMFAKADFLEQERRVLPKLKPVIIFE